MGGTALAAPVNVDSGIERIAEVTWHGFPELPERPKVFLSDMDPSQIQHYCVNKGQPQCLGGSCQACDLIEFTNAQIIYDRFAGRVLISV